MNQNKREKSLGYRLLTVILILAFLVQIVVPNALLMRLDADGDDFKDGKYTIKTSILKENDDSASMSDQMFAEKMDVEVKGETAELKMYVAFPIPAFPTMGTDGTLKNAFIEYKGVTYNAVSDIETKPLKPMKITNAFFGLEEGKEISTQILTFSNLPKEALGEEYLNAGCYVNVMMNSDVNFRIQLGEVEIIELYEEPVGSKFIINENPYMTRLRINYSDEAEFQFGFKEYSDENVQIFTKEDGQKLIATGKIKINDGNEWTWKDAGIDFDNPKTKSSFKTINKEFIKEFVDSDTFSITVILEDGTEVKTVNNLNNNLTAEEREAFKASLVQVDKTALQAEIEKAEALTESDYTADSFALVTEKLATAKEVVANEDATQEDVNNAKNALTEAIENLVENSSNTEYTIKEGSAKLEKYQYGDELRLEFEPLKNGEDLEEAELENIDVEINGTSYGKVKDLWTRNFYGTVRVAYAEATSFTEKVTDLCKIKDEIDKDELNVKLTMQDASVLEFVVKNNLTAEERAKIKGETPQVNKTDLKAEVEKAEALDASDYTADSFALVTEKLATAKEVVANEDATQEDVNNAKNALTKAIENLEKNDSVLGVFSEAKVRLVKANDHSAPSMAGAVLKENAELLTSKDGKSKLIIHFQVADVMGRESYTTAFRLDGLTVDFVMAGDNSGVAVIDLEDDLSDITGDTVKVYDGYIDSNQMGSNVALEISKVNKVSDNKTKLDELVKTAEAILADTSVDYYSNTKEVLKTAIANAKNTEDYKAGYAKLIKAIAQLREIKENPFEGDTVFHVQVSDPSFYGGKMLQKRGRVTVNEEGTPVLKVYYSAIDEWDGHIAFNEVVVYDKDGNEMPSTYTLDEDDMGTLEFAMTYIPSSGIYKVKQTEVSGRVNNSDLILDYATIKKGAYRELIKEAIEKYNKYKRDDWTSEGPLEEIKDSYTEASWTNYDNALKACNDTYKTPGTTQETIDKVINDLKNAKKALVFKVKAGKGNTINLGIKGLNNPNNYYTDSTPHPLKVGWAGSKIVFGKENNIYHVLNDGHIVDENDQVQNIGKMYILSEDLLVKQPFTTEEVTADTMKRWNESVVREYLNDDFYNNSFSDKEKAMILKTTLETKDVGGYWNLGEMGDGISTEDYIFLPSLSDIKLAVYGFAHQDGRDIGANYALRNVGVDSFDNVSVAGVKPLGRVEFVFNSHSKNMEELVAMNIDSKNILMTIKADVDLSEGLSAPVKTDSNIWKLLVIDDAKTLTVKDSSKLENISYSTTNSENDDLVAMITRNGDYKTGELVAVGKVGQTKTEGSVSIDLSTSDFDKDTDKLYIFTAKVEKGTSYASLPVEIKVQENVVNKTKLKDAIDKAKSIEQENYTEETVKVLIAKLKVAEEIFAKVNASQDEVDTAKNELNKAVQDLKVNEDGRYTINTKIIHEYEDKPSMANPMFVEKIDANIKGDVAQIKVYVAYPVPAFPTLGTDGTVKDVYIMYNGLRYDMAMDITTQPLKPAKETSTGFGFVEGKEIPTEVLTVSLPKEALNQEYLITKAYVNVVMNKNVTFRIQLGDRERLGDLTGDENIEAPNGIDPNNGGSGNGGPTIPVDDDTVYEALDYKNLSDGTYNVKFTMKNYGKDELSMSNMAVLRPAQVVVEDGKYYLQLTLQAIEKDWGGNVFKGYLGTMKYQDENGEFKDVEVLETYDDTDAFYDIFEEKVGVGAKYPKVVRYPIAKPVSEIQETVAEVFVPVMESLTAGTGTQKCKPTIMWIGKDETSNPGSGDSNPTNNDGTDGNQGQSGGSSANKDDKNKKEDGKDEKITDEKTPLAKLSKIEYKMTAKEAEAKVSKFTDVKSNWAKGYITKAVRLGLFEGTSKSTFSPKSNTTRAMIYTILQRIDSKVSPLATLGRDDGTRKLGRDDGAKWYSASMKWAKAKGISDGTRPESDVTRQELVTMLYRYAGKPEHKKDLNSYKDAKEVSSWAKDAMAWAVEKGIIKGRKSDELAPKGTATRQELAAIILRFLGK